MRIFLILLYILFAKNTFGQKPVVGLPKVNVVYMDVENPVEIAIAGIKAKDLVVKANWGKLTGSNGKYSYSFTFSDIKWDYNYKFAPPALYIGVKRKNKTRWLDSVVFSVRTINDRPDLSIGYSFSGNYEDFTLDKKKVSAGIFENQAFADINYKVESYRILLFGKEVIFSETVTGDSFTKGVIEHFELLHNKGFLIIDSTVISINGIKLQHSHSKPLVMRIGDAYFPEETLHITGLIQNEGDIDSVNSIISLDRFKIEHDLPPGLKTGLWTVVKKNGNRLMDLHYNADTLLSSKTFHENNKPKIFKKCNKDSSGKFYEYFENGKLFKQGDFLVLPFGTNAIEYDVYSKDTVTDYTNIDKHVFGKWEIYHKNGKLKETGSFDTSSTFENVIICYAPSLTYPEPSPPYICSVRHGLWKFYDENGNLIRQTVYDKGRIKE